MGWGSGDPYGVYVLDNLYVHDNTVTVSRCSNGYGLTGIVTNAGDPTVFTTHNNRFAHNTYHLLASDGGLGAHRFAWSGSITHTWSTWQLTDGQDATGTADVVP